MVEATCPDCGAPLSSDEELIGLCPECLLGLALDAPSLLVELENSEAPTIGLSDEGLGPGQVLGNRYRLRSLLGRGGMGEVWRAFDLKLRLDVALKALRVDLLEDERALETLRQEVRTAREVGSPNVCRVFDLIELEGRELVSMEYVDGTTLSEVIHNRGPLDLDEARQIAAQFLAGLEAIHNAGLVHRDLKPENLMLTRAGRVVVMDFGIAKGLAEAGADRSPGTIVGTPAYMAPEQMRGEPIDARADIFAAGVVLAELVEPGGMAESDSRRRLWEALHREPPVVSETPWAPVIRRTVSVLKDDRYSSASALARALEEVTLRAAGDEDLHPYPGLSSFTQQDAEYFFGRELEVEEMIKKLGRAHLLALIGPSGAGKSSFLRAGLLPVLPDDWSTIVTTPGNRPMTALGQALAEELSDDRDAVRDLLRFEEPDVAVSLFERWRRRHTNTLVIVDQFEELFTQNPNHVQATFAELLGRLPLDADTHVLLSMRDDFLFRCQAYAALQPAFSDLTPLGTLSGSALRRALVQPALKCGYRFEDDALVDEMVAEIEGERGALPLLAFAASRLWALRDREQGLLTREAYEHIGGVAGALAQHAEATLERIGHDRLPIVRELFRNLVTAEGTRAVRDHDELLSVFSDGGPGTERRGAERPQVFLSYSREDAGRAKLLASALETKGFNVWWDRHISPGENFDEVIEQALENASAVVVLWSKTSVSSNWVKAEASQALEHRALFPVLVDRVAPPLEFRRLEAAELQDWSGETENEELEQLATALDRFVRGRASERGPMGSDQRAAAAVLEALVDARLLVSYEAEG